MRGLVYIFIGLFAVAIGATAYFGLTFTPIEAALAAIIGLAFALIYMQHKMHARDQHQLNKAIQDLSRLLSTDAQAGLNLSQRLNALADVEPEKRLEMLEGDVSVLGTVVRQLAESMADMEERKASVNNSYSPEHKSNSAPTPPRVDLPLEPVIPAEMLRQALAEDRLINHIEPIITLPQRRTHGYDLVPRLMLEDGELAKAEDFMPISNGDDLIAEIEALALMDAITLARRSLTAGDPIIIYVPLSTSTLKTDRETHRVLSLLSANKAVAKYICFVIPQSQWDGLNPQEREAVEEIVKNGVGFSLSQAQSLRLDYAELAALGVRSVRANTPRFVDSPASYTDFHTADISAYVNRFEVDLILTKVESEQHVLTLLDDGIGLAQGPHLAKAGPINPDFSKSREFMAKPKLA